MKISRKAPTVFEFPDGSRISVPPIRWGQMGEVYALDPERRETPMEITEQRHRQVAILIRHATCTDAAGRVQPVEAALDALSAEDEQDIIHGVIARHHGLDPADSVAAFAAIREIVKKKHRAAGVTP